jgi:serine/threonine protein kinase
MTPPEHPPPDPDLCGARYRILGRIAIGGMAEVFDGDDGVLGRRVAIKVLKPTLTDEALEGDPGERAHEAAHAVDRMRVEARALALVAHPNVVAAYDFGTTADGRPFIVTERLMGRALDAELRERGALPWEEATALVVQVLSALGAAHAKGVVHRDLKPGNVFLCDDGSAKLLDFGVAKIAGEAAVKHVAPVYRTKDGVMVGTPKYTTPEQALSQPVDARTDVYAAGLLLFALLTGRHAFADQPDVVGIVDAMRSEGADPPSRHAPEPIPPALDAVVLIALAWHASERFQSAAAFADALRAIVETSEDPMDGPTRVLLPKRGLPRPVFAVLVAVSAAIVLVALLLLTGGPG